VFERYNIVSECDLVEAAKKLNTHQPVPLASNRDGHNSGTEESDRGPAGKSVSKFLRKLEAPPGFEPGVEVLQTSALPLGDGALAGS
jgi:hypothetical protein